MTLSDVVYVCLGLGALGAAVLPRVVSRRPLTLPMVFLAAGVLIELLPVGVPAVDPVRERLWVEHTTEVCVIVSLMGAGLAIDRPFGWRRWSSTWRLLGITMPLTMAVVALLAWGLLDWPPAAALLLGAVLAPTDPVLAGEVRVGEPLGTEHDEDEVRLSLTSEAGLNDGLAFPFVYAAIALAAAAGTGWSADWIGAWALTDLLGKCAVGLAVGGGVGWLLGWMFFRVRASVLRLSEHMEGFVALGATFVSYGIAEVLHGYGFLSVFVTACVIRAAERSHGYHKVLHEFTEQIERLLTAVLLFLLGGYLVAGALSALTLMGAVVAVLVLLVVRPLTGWLAQARTAMGEKERAVVAVFGIRGIGSLFYLSYALGQESFGGLERELWAIVALTVVISVVLHGVMATPAIGHLDRRRDGAELGGRS
ncbi:MULTISPECIES: cation:proton antiporter [Streptomyces]|uniref:Potassium/proton antiporter n=2 Tax=Streptomyces TaxID=1883 RepID=A0A2N9BLY7_STRCX|nr:cation:proton antiporter [Streptomyces chartreusis]MYS92927.1 sodium:proton antiporter [Streptomyces sp. SID5464]SOR84361.1 potassium/proton antiporter [Streptomyces chartreusis NRRL 3882]